VAAKQPELSESQWRELYNMLEEATPIGMAFESDKDELAWYRRSSMIMAIKNCFGFRARNKKQEGDPAQGSLAAGNGNPDPSDTDTHTRPDDTGAPVETTRKRGKAVPKSTNEEDSLP
jgi:hypothetical protein